MSPSFSPTDHLSLTFFSVNRLYVFVVFSVCRHFVIDIYLSVNRLGIVAFPPTFSTSISCVYSSGYKKQYTLALGEDQRDGTWRTQVSLESTWKQRYSHLSVYKSVFWPHVISFPTKRFLSVHLKSWKTKRLDVVEEIRKNLSLRRSHDGGSDYNRS